MPTKPTAKTLNASSVDILNAIRNAASPDYQARVPVAQATAESIREIGTIMLDYQAVANEFLSALVNRIGMVILTGRMYQNPWAMFKRGMLEYGETVEEIFTELAKPFEYDPAVAEDTVWKRAIPDVRAAFHSLNYQKGYEQTVQRASLKQAFLSLDGVTQLISSIIDSMYKGANYDEFCVMKYLISRVALNGGISAKTVPAVSADSIKGIVATVKSVTNSMTFMSRNYNMAGVRNFSRTDDIYIILTSTFDATMDVEVLAAAFNMDKAEFLGRRVLVDSFGVQDTERLAALFGSDPNYVPLTTAQLTTLAGIQAVIVDREWFMIFDVDQEMSEIYNPKGRYWNYFFHTWKIFSVSPFAQAILFTTGTNSVTAVTVAPATGSVTAPGVFQLAATVTGSGLYNSAVSWSVDTTSAGNGVTVSPSGLVTVPTGVSGTITVTATSVGDPSKSGTATITASLPSPTSTDEV